MPPHNTHNMKSMILALIGAVLPPCGQIPVTEDKTNNVPNMPTCKWDE